MVQGIFRPHKRLQSTLGQRQRLGMVLLARINIRHVQINGAEKGIFVGFLARFGRLNQILQRRNVMGTGFVDDAKVVVAPRQPRRIPNLLITRHSLVKPLFGLRIMRLCPIRNPNVFITEGNPFGIA